MSIELVDVPIEPDEVEKINEEELRDLEEEDEVPIRHNQIPETDSEKEEDEDGHGDGERTGFRTERNSEDKLAVGRVFFNREDIIGSVLDHALNTGRNISQFRYDKTKLGFNCQGGNWGWRIWCSIRAHRDKWEVRSYNDKHTCVPNGSCDMLKVHVIARLFMDKIRDYPNYYMPMKIEELIKEKWKINVSRPQCQKARNMALKWIEQSYDRQFKRPRDYAAEILESNPNSSVDVETLRNAEGLDVFNRFYVCYDVIRRSWKETCRPLIGMDGCFLRSKMKEQLLVALERDADNKIYPLAWAVVQVENSANWLWFVRKIKLDLTLGDGEGYVMVSDRQKGLIRAVELQLPKIEHRMCVRHIYANLKTKHGKKPEMKPLVWQLAWSYNEADFNENLEKIRAFDMEVYNDVLRMNPNTWCRAFYRIGSCCEDVENNSTKSFNASIVKAREKPLVPMVELIARLAIVRIWKSSFTALNYTGVCTPYLQKLLAVELPDASECSVFRSTNMMYLVQYRGCAYRVSLESRTCPCRKWEIRGIPCELAYGVMLSRKLEVEDYVDHWFRAVTWRRTYEEGLTPTRGERFWAQVHRPEVHRPPSPPQLGRKKKIVAKKQKRKKGLNESPTKKQSKHNKRTMHCAIFGAAHHNARFHKRQSQSLGEPSQSQDMLPSQSQDMLPSQLQEFA